MHGPVTATPTLTVRPAPVMKAKPHPCQPFSQSSCCPATSRHPAVALTDGDQGTFPRVTLLGLNSHLTQVYAPSTAPLCLSPGVTCIFSSCLKSTLEIWSDQVFLSECPVRQPKRRFWVEMTQMRLSLQIPSYCLVLETAELPDVVVLVLHQCPLRLVPRLVDEVRAWGQPALQQHPARLLHRNVLGSSRPGEALGCWRCLQGGGGWGKILPTAGTTLLRGIDLG